MTKDEALRLALEALEGADEIDCDMRDAITAIKAALLSRSDGEAQTRSVVKDEPEKYAMDIECTKCGAKQSGVLTVHTTPPQRTWVGLTDGEISDCMEMSIQKTCRAIEAKLKEKNNG